MAHSMDIGENIGKVPHSRLPGNSELTLANTLSSNPVETHVYGLRSFLLDLFVSNTYCACVVAYDWSRALRIA